MEPPEGGVTRLTCHISSKLDHFRGHFILGPLLSTSRILAHFFSGSSRSRGQGRDGGGAVLAVWVVGRLGAPLHLLPEPNSIGINVRCI